MWPVDTSSSTFNGDPELLRLSPPLPDTNEFGVDVLRGVDAGEQLRSSRFLVDTLRSSGCSPVDFLIAGGSVYRTKEFMIRLIEIGLSFCNNLPSC